MRKLSRLNQKGRILVSKQEALVVGKACYERLYSYFRLKKREPLIASGSHHGGGLTFCVRSTPLRGQKKTRKEKEKKVEKKEKEKKKNL